MLLLLLVAGRVDRLLDSPQADRVLERVILFQGVADLEVELWHGVVALVRTAFSRLSLEASLFLTRVHIF